MERPGTRISKIILEREKNHLKLKEPVHNI
jgi:hypothetical protein